MRLLLVVSFGLLSGCSSSTEPTATRVLGTIIGFNADDPQISVVVDGRAARVTVLTYGNGCFSAAGTDVEVNRLEATVAPYDYDPGCNQRDLRQVEHTATVHFDEAGTAQIYIKGLDVSRLSSSNPVGDTVMVERTVMIP